VIEKTPSQLVAGAAALVIGGSSGIGRATVRRLAENGASVDFAAIDASGVVEVNDEMRAEGFDVRGTVLDASNADAVQRFVEGAHARHGHLDILVNSAGIQRYGTVISTPEETWDEVFDINVKPMYLASKYAIPYMVEAGGGAIVNVSSAQATASQANVAAYTASKGAIVALTRAMAIDHARDGVRVNSVLPGSVDTPMLRASAAMIDETNPQRIIDEWGSLHPIGRVARSEEIADVIVFLVSPFSSFVTGAEVRVDGGTLAGVALAAPNNESKERTEHD
jgi:NAD(P)-dependent dehydrogenase (short-subunit alcohol dehydrogenase family)